MSATVAVVEDDKNWRPFDRPVPEHPNGIGWEDIDPVGAMEIGERLGIDSRSVHVANRRGSMPEPSGNQVNGFDAWEWRTILWWAGETKRLRTPELVAQFEAMFEETPPAAKGTVGKVPSNVTVLVDATPDIPVLPSKESK